MNDFTEYRAAQKERRAERLPIRTEQIISLRKLGYNVRVLSAYQFRVNDCFDLYPIHNRYHNIQSNKRGGYPDATRFVLKKIPLTSQPKTETK